MTFPSPSRPHFDFPPFYGLSHRLGSACSLTKTGYAVKDLTLSQQINLRALQGIYHVIQAMERTSNDKTGSN